MDRRLTMARFAEPDPEPKILDECENCGAELYDGSFVYYTEDGNFCSQECVNEYYGISTKTLEEIENYEQ